MNQFNSHVYTEKRFYDHQSKLKELQKTISTFEDMNHRVCNFLQILNV
jgi:hypothetical protein